MCGFLVVIEGLGREDLWVSAPKTWASVRAQPLTNLLLVGVWFAFCFLLQSLQDYSNIDVSVNGGDGEAFISKDHGGLLARMYQV